ncbi:MAG: restriction endonuclease subunit R, partial [Candidatus Poribacteria bacterium]|nr:restriction endonuclease subunit R [Candidatus Poribacteria bacterium]
GNAMLVANSILSACRLYNLFQDTPLRGKCAVVTSYRPNIESIKLEETGEGLTDKQLEYNTYRDMLSAYFGKPFKLTNAKVDQFEQEVKKRFIEEPAQMKLLIVVDKLLTGFDAPPATYLYIDKSMQDHGLFQAICRVNRIHTDDKEFGYIVDYKDLFGSLRQAMTDYTGEAFENYDTEDVEGLLKDRLEKGRERLEDAREAIKALCEPVDPPKQIADYIRYFCSTESGNNEQIKTNEQKRIKLYKLTAALVRAYANLANEMEAAGYSDAEAEKIKKEVGDYEYVRQQVKLTSGDYIDLKMFEPDMRHLLDTYIQAEESETLSTFDNMPLVQLIVNKGADAAIEKLPEGIRTSEEAIAATIENNIRRVIVDKSEINPKYYEEMSRLLDELIRQRRQDKINYRQYLSEATRLSNRVTDSTANSDYPQGIDTKPRQAFFDNLPDNMPVDHKTAMAKAIDEAIIDERSDEWRGNGFKELEIRNAIEIVILDDFDDDTIDVDKIFNIAKNQDEY